METMNIYAKKGHKVIYTGVNGTDSDQEEAKKLFKVGEVLTVYSTEVSSWITYVEFIELPCRRFNSVMFIDQPGQPIERTDFEAAPIHKIVFDTRKCESFSYQLCHAVHNSNTTLVIDWAASCRHRWKDVTCPNCIILRGVKKPKGFKSHLTGIG